MHPGPLQGIDDSRITKPKRVLEEITCEHLYSSDSDSVLVTEYDYEICKRDIMQITLNGGVMRITFWNER